MPHHLLDILMESDFEDILYVNDQVYFYKKDIYLGKPMIGGVKVFQLNQGFSGQDSHFFALKFFQVCQKLFLQDPHSNQLRKQARPYRSQDSSQVLWKWNETPNILHRRG